jgi:hypothetical protein
MKTAVNETQKNTEKAANMLLFYLMLAAVLVSLLLLGFHQ